MTSTGLLNTVEALECLGLYNPADGVKPNSTYLKYLNQRGLLNRLKIGHRTLVYKKKDCEALLKRAETEGILLKAKP